MTENYLFKITLSFGDKIIRFFFPPLSKQQLFSVCKSMQTRVVELIPQLLDEGFIEELLVVNDDLNNAFIRYERCMFQILFVRQC